MHQYAIFRENLKHWYASKQGASMLVEISSIITQFCQNKPISSVVQVGEVAYKELSMPLKAPYKWLVAEQKVPLLEHIIAEPAALPLAKDSCDMLILPHTLEFTAHEGLLSELYRALKPGGHLLVIGFEPSIWDMFAFANYTLNIKYANRESFISSSKLNFMMDKAGFNVVKRQYLSFVQPTISYPSYILMNNLLAYTFTDIYVVIAKKEVSNLNLIKNKKNVFNEKTILLPFDKVWN